RLPIHRPRFAAGSSGDGVSTSRLAGAARDSVRADTQLRGDRGGAKGADGDASGRGGLRRESGCSCDSLSSGGSGRQSVGGVSVGGGAEEAIAGTRIEQNQGRADDRVNAGRLCRNADRAYPTWSRSTAWLRPVIAF